MSYIEQTLSPTERVVFRARLHGVVLVLPTVLGFLFLIGLLGSVSVSSASTETGGMAPMMFGMYFLLFGLPATILFLNYRTAEFGVTDQRVIAKVGVVSRRTLETVLQKVEGVSVEQSLLGRALGYGTIVITGTGGTRERFDRIADPLEFRRHVQEQIVAQDARRGVSVPTSMVSPTAGPTAAARVGRAERDCPFCAERILVQARICKHCGRDVTASAPV